MRRRAGVSVACVLISQVAAYLCRDSYRVIAARQHFGQHREQLGALFAHAGAVRWQKEMGCLTKGDKNVTKRRAQELFPTLKITHAIADALLIAEYGRTQGGLR